VKGNDWGWNPRRSFEAMRRERMPEAIPLQTPSRDAGLRKDWRSEPRSSTGTPWDIGTIQVAALE